MEDDYTGGDICIDGSTDCIGNDIVYGSRTDILGALTALNPLTLDIAQASLALFSLNRGILIQEAECPEWNFPSRG